MDDKGTVERGQGEIDLLDLLIVLVKRKWLIAKVTGGAGILALAVSLILPPVYRAETKILPPGSTGQGIASQLISQLGGAAGFLGTALPVKTPAELYIEILRSRTVLYRIAGRFQLDNVYGTKYREDTGRRLLRSMRAQEEKKSGIILLAVEDRDPQRAAGMANAFVEELKTVTVGLAVSEAAQRRLFFEEQMRDAKTALAKSEEEFKGFQQKTGALQIDSQARTAIEGIARLRAQISSTEVQLKVLRTYSTAQNPDLQRVEEELRGLRAELRKLEAPGGSGHDPLMPTSRMPSVGTDYYRKLRDVKYNEMLFEFLAKQFETAKLDEGREAAVIQVIDPAIPPQRKFGPNRKLIVSLALFISFFLSILLVFLLEYIERSSGHPESRGKIDLVRKYLQVTRA